jgi:hypothetical protein
VSELGPDTTMRDIAGDKALQGQLTELILSVALRGVMRTARVPLGTADRIAEGVHAGIAYGTQRVAERES